MKLVYNSVTITVDGPYIFPRIFLLHFEQTWRFNVNYVILTLETNLLASVSLFERGI